MTKAFDICMDCEHARDCRGDCTCDVDGGGIIDRKACPLNRWTAAALVPVKPRRQTAQARPASPRRGCTGCGGNKFNPADFNQPGGADALVQELG